jgi:hypothetical protein
MAWGDGVAWHGIMAWWDGLTWWEKLTLLLAVLGCVSAILNAILNRRPSRGPSSSKLKIRERSKACHLALVELEARAGIAEAAEKLREEVPRYDLVYDAAERDSDEQRELEEEEEKAGQERTTRRLRELYFAIRDAELRKQLIAKHREGGRLGRRYLQQEMYDAAARLKTASSERKYWWVAASIYGIVLLGLGFHFFGQIGALGGLLVGYFNGRRMENEAFRERESAIAETDQDMKEAERFWNEARNHPQTFSQREARTGEPDSDSQLRAV